MKLSYDVETTAQDNATTQMPIRVCMHVPGTARNDVRVMRAATALTEAGYKVSVIDIEYEHGRPAEEEIRGVHLKHVIMPGWSIYTRRFDPWFLVRAMVVLMRSLWLLLRIPTDVYHAHDETGLPSCYIAALLRRKPLIFDAHEIPTSMLSEGRKGVKSLLKRCFLWLVPRCKAVITVSPPLVQEFSQRYHTHEVYLLRNLPRYQAIPKSDRLRQLLDLSPDVHVALYQGNLQPKRGLDTLVHAAAFLEPDIVIVMMGRSIRDMQSQLEAIIASEGISDRVKIIPAVPYEELLHYTASADIGLIFCPPGYPEPQMQLPNKLFEYTMAGLPVLASQMDAVTEVFDTYGTGQILSSFTPEAIGTTINTMLADHATLERMHNNALHAAQEALNWEIESQCLIQLYQSILQSNVQKIPLNKRSTLALHSSEGKGSASG